MKHKLYGGIEAGGTKFVCAVGSGHGELLDYQRIETKDPDETIGRVKAFFDKHPQVNKIGLGSFGPLDLDEKSAGYGTIQSSPKLNWSNFKIKKELESRINRPINIATDTDVAAIGEYHYGKAKNTNRLLYVTLGTGIGGTFLLNGMPMRGIKNSEMGHVFIPDAKELKLGKCPYHNTCLEGFSSGQAIEKTTGKKPQTIEDEGYWDYQANNIAAGLVNMVLILQPEKIILGGSISKVPNIIYKINISLLTLLGGYTEIPSRTNFIQKNADDNIGVLGAIKLAAKL